MASKNKKNKWMESSIGGGLKLASTGGTDSIWLNVGYKQCGRRWNRKQRYVAQLDQEVAIVVFSVIVVKVLMNVIYL